MRLVLPAIELPEQGKTIFAKTKYLPKTTKTLKNLFDIDLTKIEHLKTHLVKYNQTNEYGIH